MIYTVTLNPSLDYYMTVGDIVFGKTNRASSERLMPGGKGINVSAVLAELGIASVIIGFSAGFTGEALEAELERRGLKTEMITLASGMTRINLKLLGREETEINAGGPAIPNEALERLFARLDTLCSDDTLVLAGSIPPTVDSGIYAHMVKNAGAKGVRVIVDASGEALRSVLGLKPFLIKPNRQEAEELLGRTLGDISAVVGAARELRSFGVANVMITLGGDGAVLAAENGKEYIAGAIQGKVVNGACAGDSTVAGFLAGYDSYGDYPDALLYGICCGAATAQSEGLAGAEKIRGLFSQYRGSNIIKAYTD